MSILITANKLNPHPSDRAEPNDLVSVDQWFFVGIMLPKGVSFTVS